MLQQKIIYPTLEQIWKHKLLLLFAGLAAFFGANILYPVFLQLHSQTFWDKQTEIIQSIISIFQINVMQGWIIILFIMILIVIIIALLLLGNYFLASVVIYSNQIQTKKKNQLARHKNALKQSIPTLGYLTILGIIQTFFFLVVQTPAFLGKMLQTTSSLPSIMTLVLFYIFIVITVFSMIIFVFTLYARIIDQQKFFQAIKTGLTLFFSHFVHIVKIIISLVIVFAIIITFLLICLELLEYLFMTLRNTAAIYQLGIMAQTIIVFVYITTFLYQFILSALLLSTFTHAWLLFYKGVKK